LRGFPQTGSSGMIWAQFGDQLGRKHHLLPPSPRARYRVYSSNTTRSPIASKALLKDRLVVPQVENRQALGIEAPAFIPRNPPSRARRFRIKGQVTHPKLERADRTGNASSLASENCKTPDTGLGASFAPNNHRPSGVRARRGPASEPASAGCQVVQSQANPARTTAPE